MAELWDVLDASGNKTGRTVERGAPMRPDEYHLVVDVWLRNSQGQYLISRRAPEKTYPLHWEPTGGSAISGETSLQAALREVQEELGLKLDPQAGRLLFRVSRRHWDSCDFKDIWLFTCNADISQVRHQPGEVIDARWASPDEIRALMASGEFVPTSPYAEQVFTA